MNTWTNIWLTLLINSCAWRSEHHFYLFYHRHMQRCGTHMTRAGGANRKVSSNQKPDDSQWSHLFFFFTAGRKPLMPKLGSFLFFFFPPPSYTSYTPVFLKSHVLYLETWGFRLTSSWHQNICALIGLVGISLTADWGEPVDASDQKDIEAAERYIQFYLGWFATPIFRGDYPQVMKEYIGTSCSRAPGYLLLIFIRYSFVLSPVRRNIWTVTERLLMLLLD